MKKKEAAEAAEAEKKKDQEEEKVVAVEEPVVEKKVEEERPASPPTPVEEENQIDLVLYLQQTGSIIALSKLMDAPETDEGDLDDYERKMIDDMRQQQSTAD